jgi:diguanylate cyclase (GGDEF)-like protein
MEGETPSPAAPKPGVREDAGGGATEYYRAALLAVGRSAVQCCPGPGLDLERNLKSLEHRLSVDSSEVSMKWAHWQLEVQLQEWGVRTADHFKAKTDEVKELLIALARAAESVGDRTNGHANRFRDLTARLESIADLDDLTEIRSSLVQRVAELKDNVDRITRDNENLAAQLRSEVTKYETRLREVEQLVLKDQLTGVANRRSVEERIQLYIADGQTFSVLMLDLNNFKDINDKYGHPVGDELLRQFAGELQMITRIGDLVGRWGGDEFVVLLSCEAAGAGFHMERIREWVLGRYTLEGAGRLKPLEVSVEAALGIAEWRAGDTMEQVIAAADAAMYREKNQVEQA